MVNKRRGVIKKHYSAMLFSLMVLANKQTILKRFLSMKGYMKVGLKGDP